MKIAAGAALFVGFAATGPAELSERQGCPNVYIFGARETLRTQSNGFGTAVDLVNRVKAAYSGAGAEAIVYPACGGDVSCGSVSYKDSASKGTAAVVKAVTAYNLKCPSTQIVLIGYSQGAQIMDNALCGGVGATTLTGNALTAVKAAIFMGDPHYRNGLPYNVGTCKTHGFEPRPAGFICSPSSTSIIQSYCDAPDPYCCTGQNATAHQQYVKVYGSAALSFIQKRLTA